MGDFTDYIGTTDQMAGWYVAVLDRPVSEDEWEASREQGWKAADLRSLEAKARRRGDYDQMMALVKDMRG